MPATTMSGGSRGCSRDVNAYLILLVAIAALGPLQFGFHLAGLNAPKDVLTCKLRSIHVGQHDNAVSSADLSASDMSEAPHVEHSSIIPICIPMSEVAYATVSSIFTVGALVGSLMSGPISSQRGRLPAMRITALAFILGALAQTVATGTVLMAMGRLISGLGAGAATVVVPMFISEVAPPSQRGLFGVMTQIAINLGILLTQTLGYFLSHDGSWRWILAVGFFVALVQAVGLLFVPESPAWLAASGDEAKAKATLLKIRGREYDVAEETSGWKNTGGENASEEAGLLADGEVDVPASSGAGTKDTTHLGVLDVIKDPLVRPAIIAVVGVMCAQQLCGINSIVMYSVSLLKDLLPTSSALLSVIISGFNFATTVACSPLPDRLGRKTCLLISIVGQGLGSLALALSILGGVKILSAVSVFIFVGFFGLGLGPVPFMIASEMVGQDAVGATQSWALASNYVVTYLVAQFFLIINEALNNAMGGAGWVYFIFAALAAVCGVFVAWRVPETKGKASVDEVWGRERRID